MIIMPTHNGRNVGSSPTLGIVCIMCGLIEQIFVVEKGAFKINVFNKEMWSSVITFRINSGTDTYASCFRHKLWDQLIVLDTNCRINSKLVHLCLVLYINYAISSKTDTCVLFYIQTMGSIVKLINMCLVLDTNCRINSKTNKHLFCFIYKPWDQ